MGLYKYERSPGKANDQLLSLDAINSVQIKIHPNPVKDILYIDGTLSDFTIEIHTVSGKRVRISKAIEKIDVSSLRLGIYFIKLIAQKSITKYKLIKE